jgi:O-6-methylguanine DNA methyltransferase
VEEDLKTLEIKTKIGMLSVVFDSKRIYKVVFGGFDDINSHHVRATRKNTESILKDSVYLQTDISSFVANLKKFTEGHFSSLKSYRPKILNNSFFTGTLNQINSIPFGKTASYKQIATKLNSPKASRAVGTCCSKNPLPFIIPCHRVIKSNGQLGNYAFGEDLKRRLIDYERLQAS